MKQYCDGGEAVLEAFRSLGLDYIISSPGSEWLSVWEGLARTIGTVVAIDENPLKGMMVCHSLEADHYLEGEIATSLRLLVEAAKAAGIGPGKHAERHAQWAREHDRILAAERAAEAGVKTNGTIDPLALVGALREAMPDDAIYVEETITQSGILQQHLPWSEPRSFFRAGGGLGQGLGTALGVKLGAGKRPVAALIGDGSFLYDPVTQALGASKGNDLPILIVVCNNGQYRAMQVGHRHHYPEVSRKRPRCGTA